MELRQVRIRHEQFIHYLAARMSMFLRMDFGMKMSKLFTAQYSKFTQLLPNPASISIFRLEQMSGVGVLSISPRLAMTITDRMLGGKGHSVRGERYLTEIESALMEDVVQIYLEEWCRQWEDTLEITATPIGSESNGRFLQTSPHDAIMLVLCIEAALGDCSEEIQIGVPYYTIEPLIKEMQANNRKFTKESDVEKSAHWRETYAHIDVPVVAEWDACDLSVRDVLLMEPGDVLELPREIIGQTTLRIVGREKFVGEVGLEGDQVAVKITDTVQAAATDGD
jgi:flagellar motor switch protein FliM